MPLYGAHWMQQDEATKNFDKTAWSEASHVYCVTVLPDSLRAITRRKLGIASIHGIRVRINCSVKLHESTKKLESRPTLVDKCSERLAPKSFIPNLRTRVFLIKGTSGR